MNRYKPTPEEVEALMAKGWSMDPEGWWWPAGEVGWGRTYKEAIREAARRARAPSPRDGGQP